MELPDLDNSLATHNIINILVNRQLKRAEILLYHSKQTALSFFSHSLLQEITLAFLSVEILGEFQELHSSLYSKQ